MSQGLDAPQLRGQPLLVVLSGPSGVGKDSVLAELQRVKPGIWYTVNATTRPPRPGETDGGQHFFVSDPRFQEMMAQNELLEHAQVYTHWYGVPKAQVREALERGQDVVARVDIQGAASVRRQAPDAVLVFIAPPSMEELERRLRNRGTESGDELALRIEEAQKEMAQASWFDHVLVNQTGAVHATVERLLEILDTERHRVPPRRIHL